MKILSIIALFLALQFGSASAQDWKSVRMNDTNYFVHANSNINAVLYLDSVRQIGNDSIFYFYPSYQYSNLNLGSFCVDTLAPSWLGYHMTRKNNGDEIYQSQTFETWLLKSYSALNSFWTLQEKIYWAIV